MAAPVSCAITKRRTCEILEVKDLGERKGFRSVYLIDDTGKDWVRSHNGVSGFGASGLPVWGDKLYVEFDDSLEAARELYKRLVKDCIGFKIYESGNRSIHFHINRFIEPSPFAPGSDKVFVQGIAPKADMSLYRHLQPFRIEGTIHAKTGKPKVLLEEVLGGSYTVPTIESTVPKPAQFTRNLSAVFEDEVVLGLSILGSDKGQRNKRLFDLSLNLRQHGVPQEVAEWWVLTANENNRPPEQDSLVINIVRSVYGKR
jgi:hypothetical protein